jgi:taurine dehydrogenase small subunit
VTPNNELDDEEMQMPIDDATTVGLERVIHEYSDAWNRHDIDAIIAFHADDMVFDPHLGGPPARTHDEMRAQLAGLFALWPDLHFRERRLCVCGDVVLLEWTATATLALRLELGGLVAEPTGEAVTWDGLDVLGVRAGQVTRKDSYFDVLAVMRGLGLVIDPMPEIM